MTKAELMAAIADAPAEGTIYVLDNYGIGRSQIVVDINEGDVIISIDLPEDTESE